MVVYRCFVCYKDIPKDILRNRIRCPYCGSKMLYKTRSVGVKVQAR